MGFVAAFVWASIIIFIGFTARVLFDRWRIPEALPLIVIGILLGPVFHFLSKDYLLSILPIFSNLALLIILFEGGLKLNLYEVIKSLGKAFILSGVYFILSSLLIAMVSAAILKLPIEYALLLGFILGGVSGAVAVPIFGELVSEEDVKTICSLDSAISDVLVVVASLTFIQFLAAGNVSIQQAAQDIVSKFSIGLFFGLLGGIFWIRILRFLMRERYVYMLTLAFLLLLYAGTEVLGGSGAIACLVMGVVLSNARELAEILKLERVGKLRGVFFYFHEEVTFFVRTFFFVFLGVIFSSSAINVKFVACCLMIVLCMVFARYIALLPIIKDKESRTKLALIIPRGLGAAIVAALLFQYNIKYAQEISYLVTSSIMFSNIIPTLAIPIIERRSSMKIIKLLGEFSNKTKEDLERANKLSEKIS